MVLFNGLLTIKGCGFLEKGGGLHLGMLRRAQHEMLRTRRSARDARCEEFRMQS